MKHCVAIVIAFILGCCSVANAVSPRFGSTAVEKDGLTYLTGGLLTAPYTLTIPFPETYDELYCDISVWDEVTGKFVNEDLPQMSCCRAHHTAVVYEDSMYLFGGANSNAEVEAFNFTSESWFIAESSGCAPNARFGHAGAVLGNKMYIFGGIDAVTRAVLNDLWVFTLDTYTWSQVTVAGWSPSARVGARFVNWNDTLFLFGGTNNHDHPEYLVFYNDLWQLEEGEWKHITPAGILPAGRALFALVVEPQSNQLVMFGGATKGHGPIHVAYLDDLWTLDINQYFRVPEYEWQTTRLPQWTQIVTPENFAHAPARGDFAYTVTSSGVFTVFAGKDHDRETRADIWSFSFATQWGQRSCYPGYEFPWCVLNCRANDFCNFHGVCETDGTCKCDAGWKGDTCDYNVCDGYRGFSADAMNEILLPKSIETIYVKLDVIFNKLMYIRELLPSVDNSVELMRRPRLGIMANTSWDFLTNCLDENLCETTTGFERVIGCDEECGSETYCIVGDRCINGKCYGGVARNCSEEYTNNKCVNSWCDEEAGCMHSTVTCVLDPINHPCSSVHCDANLGCVYTKADCDDHNCCTVDKCDALTGQCVHEQKCADNNPCTIDSCDESCDRGKCNYEAAFCCYSSLGQNLDLNLDAFTPPPRPIGEPTLFTGAKMVPPVSTESTAQGYFWLKGCDQCELIYRIWLGDETGSYLAPESHEEGAHFYAFAGPTEVAGVVGNLPLGNLKEGVWNYCAAGLNHFDLLSGYLYMIIHIDTGDIRAQLEFNNPEIPI